MNEDKWFGLHAPKAVGWFNVAPWQKAIQFAFDAQPQRLFKLNQQQVPTGIHAWLKHDFSFCQSLIDSSRP